MSDKDRDKYIKELQIEVERLKKRIDILERRTGWLYGDGKHDRGM